MAAISIVIPVYNAARFLREALVSLQAQTFTDWECICVNDGSTDESPAIIREMMAGDSRFQLLEQANAGPSVARNRGVAHSQAPYIFFMDADDLLYSKALETLYQVVIKEQVEMAWGRIVCFKDRLPEASATGNLKIIQNDALQNWVNERFCQPSQTDVFWGIPVAACGKLFLRQRFLEVSMREGMNYGEDSLFYAHVFQKLTRVGVVDAVIYGYRQVEGSLYLQRTVAWLLGYTDAHCRVLDVYKGNVRFCTNYINRPLCTGFIRMVLTDCVLAQQVALYPVVQTMCKTFLSHSAFRFAKPRLRRWLWLGAHQWWPLLRWSYKRSTLYKKSLKW